MLAYTGLETVANLAAETREPGKTLAAEPLRRHRRRRRDLVPDRDRRDLCVPGASRPGWPRRVRKRLGTALAAGAARRGRRQPSTAQLPEPIVDVLRVFIGVTGTLILVAVDHDVVLRRRTARVLARPATTCFRAPSVASTADADLTGVDRRDGRDLGRRAPDREGRERAGSLPREPVQLRSPDRVHRRAGSRCAAPLHRAGSRASVPRSGQRAHPRDRGARRRPRSERRSRSRSGSLAIATHDAARIAGPIWLALGDRSSSSSSRLVAHEEVLGRVTLVRAATSCRRSRVRTSGSSFR